MDDIGWKVILSNHNTTKYLSKSELVGLSKTCKSVRYRLLSHLFKCITLNDFSESLDGLSFNEVYAADSEERALEKYNKSLKNLIPHVRSLRYEYEYNEILLLCIPQAFQNLYSLQLYETTLTLASFHKLMDGLNQLMYLFLNRSIFIAVNDNNNQITLSLPPSLKAFKISYGELILTRCVPNLRFSKYLKFINESNTETLKFKIESDSLPNLKSLEIDHGDQSFAETQNNIISASNQLALLSTRFSLINELSVNHFQSITSLTLTNIHQNRQNLLTLGFQTLINLKELRLLVGFTLNKFEESLLIPTLQNLVNIGKFVERVTLPYINLYSFSIEDILQNLYNLKELSFISSNKIFTLNPCKFPKTIKLLNLYNINPNFIDIESITNCHGLSVISIYYESLNVKFEQIEHFRQVKGWRIICFQGAIIKCYKE